MKREPQYLPPRQSVIYGYTRRMLDETAVNANSFAMAVAERYHTLVAPDVRHVKLRLGDGDELFRAMENNGQVLRRYMDGTVKVLPADLEDAWVSALPEPYRSDCERDLARRRGHLCVRLDQAGTNVVQGVGELTTEFGELLCAFAPALADGRINAADVKYALQILNKSDDLVSAILSVRRAISTLLPEGDRTHA
jgi:hypothetical protein